MEGRIEKDEIEGWIKENTLVKTLLDKSGLDKSIFKALLLYYWREEVTFKELARNLGIKKPGAWKRWRKGLDSVIQAFYTIELAVYAGVLDPEIVQLLTEDLQDYVELSKGKGDPEEIRDRIEKRMVEMKKQGF